MQEKILKGFIADKSPFSFKHPIFFSCPNSKQAVMAKGGMLGSSRQVKHKRQLFTGMKQTAPEVEEKKVQNFMVEPERKSATDKTPKMQMMEKAMKSADVKAKETPIMRLAKTAAPFLPKPKAKTQEVKKPELPKVDIEAKKKELQEAFVETVESKSAYKQFTKVLEDLEKQELSFPDLLS